VIPLTKLKKDVLFNGELTKVVDVLKGIAAARFYTLQRQLVLFEKFFKVAEEFLVPIDFGRVTHPFVQAQTGSVGVLMVTSDAGFLGGLNTQVVSTGLSQAGPGGRVSVIGERGTSVLRDVRQGFTTFPGIQDSKRFALAMAVRDHLVDQVLSGECGRVVVVYPKPISFAVQEVTVETLLPASAWVHQGERPVHLIWESRMDDIVEYVVIQWIGHRLDQIFALSRLAEMAARAVHLEGSYQELTRQGKKLKLHYFRARHEVIDRSMREIFAAQLLYGKSRAA